MARKTIGFAAARKLGQKALEARLVARAEQGQAFVVESHETAPRGGRTLNVFGQPRSAPGEPPAIEHGNLLRRLSEPVQLTEGRVRLMVNYAVLENYNPNARTAPRPLGVPMVQFLRVTNLPRPRLR